jgi:hypothetical protein
MGLFKSVKDMRVTVGAAPRLTDQANHNQMTARARVMQLAPAHTYRVPSAPARGNLFEPIAGVELATYAQIAVALARHGYDEHEAVGFAASQGIDSASWQAALHGWTERIAAHPVVAVRFNALCTGRV